MKDTTQNKIAVFIDCENVSPFYAEQIFAHLESRGEIIINRAFKDCKTTIWDKEIAHFGLEVRHVSHISNAKNSADIALCINALDTLAQNIAHTYAIVSSDSDFYALILRIRERGCRALGFGEARTSQILQRAYSEFITLHSRIPNHADSDIIGHIKTAICKIAGHDISGFKNVMKLNENLQKLDSNLTLKKILKHYKMSKHKKWRSIFDKFSEHFEYKYAGKNNSTLLVRLRQDSNIESNTNPNLDSNIESSDTFKADSIESSKTFDLDSNLESKKTFDSHSNLESNKIFDSYSNLESNKNPSLTPNTTSNKNLALTIDIESTESNNTTNTDSIESNNTNILDSNADSIESKNIHNLNPNIDSIESNNTYNLDSNIESKNIHNLDFSINSIESNNTHNLDSNTKPTNTQKTQQEPTLFKL